jgi:hypothetical protein
MFKPFSGGAVYFLLLVVAMAHRADPLQIALATLVPPAIFEAGAI